MTDLLHISLCAFIVILTFSSTCTAETQKEKIEFEPEELVTYSGNITDGDEILTVEASFQPLLISTMKREALPKQRSTERTLTGLRSWTNVNTPWKNFGATDFKGFLPPTDDLIDSSQPYNVITQIDDIHKHFRYNPPLLDRKVEITLHQLLFMVQDRPFLYTRSGPHGLVACIRAYNHDYFDISFRVHAEFQLSEPPLPPVWLIPAHLSGRLIIERQAKRVLYFDMAVPQDRHPNVAMEWLTTAQDTWMGNLNEDIGYIPELQLKATRDSKPMYSRGRHIRKKFLNTTAEYMDVISNIQWEKQVTHKEASLKILQHMYPFLKLHYHNFITVWPEAKRLHKPVHFIISQGYLDDQTSCRNIKFLRDVILEDLQVMDILEKHYVYGWCVFNDLKVMGSSDQLSSQMKKLLDHYTSSYKYPFTAVVALSNGKILRTADLDLQKIFYNPAENEDDSLKYDHQRDDPVMKYIKFLESSLEEATEEMLLEDYNHDEL